MTDHFVEAPKKVLSPAAQAVLDSMHRSYDHEPTRRALAAGVLRAAADGCSTNWMGLTVIHHLHAIAGELEGQ